MNDFRQLIVNWYNINKRNLPWRNTNNPYFIWLSEIILQQTRVEQGLPYYLKFTEKYPTIDDLAIASEDEVLKLWQGLGYYSRARNLHHTARYIHNKLNGKFPDDYNKLLELKGIGKYTAAAIVSFSFNQPSPIVDGNVFRVFSRIFGISTPIDSTKGEKEFYELAASLIDKKNPYLFNQAIMEFGALQCVPQNPDCKTCCFHHKCYAFAKHIVEQLPVKYRQSKQRNRYFNYFILNTQNKHIYIRKRINNDIWMGLYEFPLIETKKHISKKELIKTKEWHSLFDGSTPIINEVSKPYKYILTHQKIYARFWEMKLHKESEKRLSKNYLIISKVEIVRYAVPKLIENYLNNCLIVNKI